MHKKLKDEQDLNKSINGLKHQIEALRAANDESSEREIVTKGVIQRLKDEIFEVSSRSKEDKTTIDQLERFLNDSKNDLDAANMRIFELENGMKTSTIDFHKQERVNLDLKSQFDNMHNRLITAESRIDDLTNINLRLENENERLSRELSMYKNECIKLKSVLNNLYTDNDHLNQQIIDKEEQIADYKRSMYSSNNSNEEKLAANTLSRYNNGSQKQSYDAYTSYKGMLLTSNFPF